MQSPKNDIYCNVEKIRKKYKKKGLAKSACMAVKSIIAASVGEGEFATTAAKNQFACHVVGMEYVSILKFARGAKNVRVNYYENTKNRAFYSYVST